ncbi:hypothetical protein Rrhod_0729 [Rhodococcus rhodnii LMG 5362]|uniref:Uncharacterized protein n=1 Tax=Rhodococcus rhodnii LMG 5362 TaxID=1273125 RepID=R7WRL7_9NOCA|nr:hypothetical protein Rrhod_0729 [Rhodococcus rhodnii LMG 5362]
MNGNLVEVMVGISLGIAANAALIATIVKEGPRQRWRTQHVSTGSSAHPARHLASDRFEAWTHCPSCGAYAAHLMREPRRATAADIEAWRRRRHEFYESATGADWEQVEIRSFGGGLIRTTSGPPVFREPRPIDEGDYETIRICECGEEWGQR